MAEGFVCAAIKPIAAVLEVDWLTGEVRTEPRHLTRTPADAAACAAARAVADSWGCDLVVVAVAGPAAERVLRDTIAEGATRAIRVVVGDDDVESTALSAQWRSETVAAALALVTDGAAAVVCGDASGDRASGTVPARLAQLRGLPQALSLRELTVEGGSVRAMRRLDAGRRERLAIDPPCVLSVEAGAAATARAPLGALLAATATDAPYEVRRVPVPPGAQRGDPAGSFIGPFRPPASALAAPTLRSPVARGIELAGTLSHHEPPEVLVATPDEAATAILTSLERWGMR